MPKPLRGGGRRPQLSNRTVPFSGIGLSVAATWSRALERSPGPSCVSAGELALHPPHPPARWSRWPRLRCCPSRDPQPPPTERLVSIPSAEAKAGGRLHGRGCSKSHSEREGGTSSPGHACSSGLWRSLCEGSECKFVGLCAHSPGRNHAPCWPWPGGGPDAAETSGRGCVPVKLYGEKQAVGQGGPVATASKNMF